MRAQEFITETISSFADTVQKQLGLVRFDLYEKDNDIYLDTIIVGKKNMGQGMGTKALEMLTDYADKMNKRIILTPAVKDSNHGTTSRSRLVKFYKQFGFKESKGRNIDFVIGAGKMYRDPRN
jgi:phage terminase large subunit